MHLQLESYIINKLACEPNPCQNNGTCNNLMSSMYSCSCNKDYSGSNCQFNTTSFNNAVSKISQSISNLTNQNITNSAITEIVSNLNTLGNVTNSTQSGELSNSITQLVSNIRY
jgi:hypothetical protein